MRTSSLPHARWLSLATVVLMHAASWPGLASILVVVLAFSAAWLLAERELRKRLIQFKPRTVPGGRP